MADKRLFFLFNPKAGKAQIKNHLMNIVDVFVKGGYEVEVYPTQGQRDAVRAVRERKKGFDLLVCCGGDGTLDEVVTGMMQSREILPIGYIPAGSTNDFANSLELPKGMVKAANVIVDGRNFACDIGKFNEAVFVYIAAFGLFTDVSYETDQGMKNALGHAAYILEGVKRLPSIKAFYMKFTYGDTVVEGEFIYGMVTNSVSVGGFKNITGKSVELDDGEFEVTLIRRPLNALELNEIVGALLNRDQETEALVSFKTSRLQVESQEAVAWTLDGEYGGEHREVLIENLKQAVPIRVKGES
ncbi:MAG: diacylglycerol kinase family lipid kinase [Lachnospiraceae bacterium]|nr:diacylglycerol kinase family lipid kinase [Lachnospiraceae bacterium]